MSNAAYDFNRLSVSERIQLVEDLWDSIAASGADIPLTSAEIQELDRRLDEFEANPGVGVPWDEVRARIEERLRLCS
ncbi:MAG: addiction module protein [Actinobacteria bacterium]|nr:addiction module protein [Actinomycetota bacterium]MCL5887440.1 addiction module protein [Actinomycetota bacterium]